MESSEKHAEELNILLRKYQPGVTSSMATPGIQRADRPTSPLASPCASPRSSRIQKSNSDSKKHHKSKKKHKEKKEGKKEKKEGKKEKSKSDNATPSHTPRSLRESPLRHSGYSVQEDSQPSTGTTSEEDEEPTLMVEWNGHLIPYNIWMNNYSGYKPDFKSQCAWCLGRYVPDNLNEVVQCCCRKYIFCRESCYELFMASGHINHCDLKEL